MRTISLAALLAFAASAYGADEVVDVTVDFARSGTPALWAYQGNAKSYRVALKNNGAAVSLTNRTPFFWWAPSTASAGVITASVSSIVATSGTFTASFSAANLATNGAAFVYGVGVSGPTTARIGLFTIFRDPYAAGGLSLDVRYPINASLYSWTGTISGVTFSGVHSGDGSGLTNLPLSLYATYAALAATSAADRAASYPVADGQAASNLAASAKGTADAALPASIDTNRIVVQYHDNIAITREVFDWDGANYYANPFDYKIWPVATTRIRAYTEHGSTRLEAVGSDGFLYYWDGSVLYSGACGPLPLTFSAYPGNALGLTGTVTISYAQRISVLSVTGPATFDNGAIVRGTLSITNGDLVMNGGSVFDVGTNSIHFRGGQVSIGSDSDGNLLYGYADRGSTSYSAIVYYDFLTSYVGDQATLNGMYEPVGGGQAAVDGINAAFIAGKGGLTNAAAFATAAQGARADAALTNLTAAGIAGAGGVTGTPWTAAGYVTNATPTTNAIGVWTVSNGVISHGTNTSGLGGGGGVSAWNDPNQLLCAPTVTVSYANGPYQSLSLTQNCYLTLSTNSMPRTGRSEIELGLNLRAYSLTLDTTIFDTNDLTSLSANCWYALQAVKGPNQSRWRLKQVGSPFATPAAFIDASGGIITTYTLNGYTYRLHAFTNMTGATNFNVITGGTGLDVLLVAGGGAGGRGGYDASGGGGAGGYIWTQNLTVVSASNYSLSVGGGGPYNASGVGGNGTNTVAFSLTAIGGGGGGWDDLGGNGASGGSGGGAGARRYAGSGTSGQGYAGGAGDDNTYYQSGGGGGGSTAGEAASVGLSSHAGGRSSGWGGTGVVVNVTGANTYYCGGGAGGADTSASRSQQRALGGAGGGGNGAYNDNAANGVDGFGGGGGGGGWPSGSGGRGGNGGVYIRYRIE